MSAAAILIKLPLINTKIVKEASFYLKAHIKTAKKQRNLLFCRLSHDYCRSSLLYFLILKISFLVKDLICVSVKDFPIQVVYILILETDASHLKARFIGPNNDQSPFIIGRIHSKCFLTKTHCSLFRSPMRIPYSNKTNGFSDRY